MARKDKRGRVLKSGESVRDDGRYQFKYIENGEPKFVYSWRLEETDKLPSGKRPCKALRTMEREINQQLGLGLLASEQKMTVLELVEKYLKTKTKVRPSKKQVIGSCVMFLRKRNLRQDR